jgi:hypothetical protein
MGMDGFLVGLSSVLKTCVLGWTKSAMVAELLAELCSRQLVMGRFGSEPRSEPEPDRTKPEIWVWVWALT